MSNQKGFAPILVILLVAILVVGGYFVYQKRPVQLTSSSPSQNETVNWKTYINEDYNFSLKYPPQFSVKVQKYPNGTGGRSIDKTNPVTYYLLSFYINENGIDKYSSYAINVQTSLGKTISQQYSQDLKLTPINTLGGTDEAVSWWLNGRENGIESRIYRLESTFFEIEPTIQDSTSTDKIWNYPVLDTLKFTQ